MTASTRKLLIAHLAMASACACWGLMAPVGKEAMTHGLDGISMVTFRVCGGALLFWITSYILHFASPSKYDEHVPRKDKLMFAGAGLFGLVLNQCNYTIGLSITSPANASIVTTSMPIFAMILSWLILKEPLSGKKVGGVLMGCAGAIILILTSASATNAKEGNALGDMLCMFAQFSFALYLSLFNPLIKRYNVFTINKWMFLWASVMILPFTCHHVVTQIAWTTVSWLTWAEALYVVFFGTYIGYILTMIGQRSLRPTVVSVYNYVQPIVSVSVSLMLGIAILSWNHLLAVVLVFSGVGLVIKSRAKNELTK